MKNKKVSIIVVYKDYYINFNNCIMSLLNQTYKNIEIIIVNESSNRKTELHNSLNNILMQHPEIKIVNFNDISEPLGYLQVADHISGNYILFIRFGEVLVKDYIANAVKAISESDMAMTVSKLAFYFPEETITALYAYEMQDYPVNRTNPFDTFLDGAQLFWGYYCLDNKLISRKLWNSVKNKLNNISLHNSLGCGEDFFISYYLWYMSETVISVDEYIVLPWKNEDKLYTEICHDTDNVASRSFYNLILSINENCSHVSSCVDKKRITDTLFAYCCRYIWRAGWAYDKDRLEHLQKKLSLLLNVSDFKFSGEAKKIEDNNKYIDLTSEIDIKEREESSFNGKINIYVSMHKDSYVPPVKQLIPIQVGAAISDSRISNVLYDDIGDNISAKNKRYCELTAQYWVWKNVKDADYYGFWHYRRYFSFNLDVELDMWGNLPLDSADDKTLLDLNITEKFLDNVIPNYDLIVPIAWTCDEGHGPMTVLEHWRNHFSIEDITVTMQVIAEKYPKFVKYFNETLMDTKAIFCNMFIMKKEFFEEYNTFCFDVLEEVEKRVDHSKYNVERYRTLGHIAERLVNVYIRYLIDNKPNLKILSLPVALFKNTVNTAALEKISTSKKYYVAVALACDDNYMPYTGTLLQSIVENAKDEDTFYDIVIMHNSISEKNQRICTGIVAGRDNISIRFLNISRNFATYAAVHVDRHLTVETYFRFMIPDLFKDYDKVLYLDCDMVVNDDIAKLFKIDIQNHYIAATRDLDFIASCEEPGRGEFYEQNILRYIKIDAPENYFQAGVIIFNIGEITKDFDTQKLFSVALSRNWYYHDQDVLNYLFNGKVYFLEQHWNILSMLESGSYRSRLFKEYLYAKYNMQYAKERKNPSIIHFAGVPKPWDDLNCDFAEYFWIYARKSPYYEQLLKINNSRAVLPNGSLVFYCDNTSADNVGAPLFTIKCNTDDWTSSYADVEIMYLTDNDIPCAVNRLSISSRIVPEGKSSINRVSKFSFEKTERAEIFKENIGFTVNEDKSITVWAKFFNIYEGFAWRILLLESRDFEKPSVIVEHQGIVNTVKELPIDIQYSKMN